MESTRIKDMYKALKQGKFDVYFPGQHIGDCTSEYVVVKPSISTNYMEFSTNINYVDVLCYVPQRNFSSLEPLIQRVESCIRDALFPMIKCQHDYTEPFYDDSVKGWMQRTTFTYYTKVDSELYLYKQNNKEE